MAGGAYTGGGVYIFNLSLGGLILEGGAYNGDFTVYVWWNNQKTWNKNRYLCCTAPMSKCISQKSDELARYSLTYPKLNTTAGLDVTVCGETSR